MRNIASLFSTTVALMVALSGCSASDAGQTQNQLVGQDPLLGTWTYSGSVPSLVNITLTFNADHTLSFVEQIAPATLPAGSSPDPDGCVTTDSFSATYAEAVSGGVNTLDWAFTNGTANAVSGCNDASLDSAGTPLTDEAITDYIAEGDVPPMALTYTATATTLLLTSASDGTAGVGHSPGTTFTKSN